MSVSKIKIFDFTCDDVMQAATKLYLATQKENFPNAKLIVNVKTGPRSVMNLAIYESYEEAQKKLIGRQKYQDAIAITVKDTFYYEGDLNYFYHDPKAEIVSEYAEKDRLFFEAERKAEK